jgi:hypothetical protein
MQTLMLVAGFPMLLAGCAGSTSGRADQLGETRDRIIESFKSEAGIGFIRRSVPKEIRKFGNLPRFERLDSKLSKLQAKRYGHFTIWVYEDRQARDRDMSQPGSPDADGIYWYNDTPERGPTAGKTYWGAEKRYGENVLLSWDIPSRKRELSTQWGRVDALLRKSVG